MGSHYSGLDWAVFVAYGLLIVLTGWFFNRQRAANSQDYFLGGNQMPTWIVAISVLATSQSAATFIGGPDQGYQGDLSYLATNIGALIAVLFVAKVLIPKFYQYKVYTVYELLEKRMGTSAKRQAGLMYLFGRVFASGARLYMAAIAVSMILFGDIAPGSVISATVILAAVGVLYTVFGGIRTVIYSDVVQCGVYVSAAICVIYFLLKAIPADMSQIINVLQHPAADAPSKLALFKFNWDFSASGVFNMASVLTGFVLLNIAAFGLDQDMTQRVLTCKSAKDGSKAMLMSIVMVVPVMFLFIVIGLLLFIFYQRPDIMLGNEMAVNQEFNGEKITIFMYYVLNEIPAGVKGLVTIGIIAAALSTLNSGLNSMSSVLIQDIYRPWLAKNNQQRDEHHFVKAGQAGMVIVSIALGSMAVLCYYWQQYTEMPLLKFALSVMVFSYSGLLGVYFTALFTQRGSQRSVLAALIVGFLVTLAFQPYVMQFLLPAEWQINLGFTWQLCIGTLISFLVCVSGNSDDENRNMFKAGAQ
ncbi:sodium:solute symporter family transporter [Neptunicella marina]|uniref:Sodium/solute symporter n=1 Tax=Neptunicella marina TaxID=2125989 RepID=A0A8J6LYV7_9ALTE|nr:sodium/solute symporter [Neptunicella marina]